MEKTTSLVIVCLLQLTASAISKKDAPTCTKRIDTHCHFVPPFYAELLQENNITAGGRAIPSWSAIQHLEVMDLLNVSLSIVAISTPAAVLTRDYPVNESRQLARRLNEYAYNLSMEYPQRFSFFATLTLPDVEGSVAEAIYALDTLNAAGVMILATSSDELLGSPRFDPLYAELDKRNATVFVHPSQSPCPGQQSCKISIISQPSIWKATPLFPMSSLRWPNVCCLSLYRGTPGSLLLVSLRTRFSSADWREYWRKPRLKICRFFRFPIKKFAKILHNSFWGELTNQRRLSICWFFGWPLAPVNEGSTALPPFAVDFLLDTTRAAANLIFRNVTLKYPNVKHIFAHSGGFLPFATFRIVKILKGLTNQTEEAIMSQLEKFYVDTALSASKYALPSTISLLGTNHLTFGSDYPFAPADAYVPNTENLDQFLRKDLTIRAQKQINFKTAADLFSHVL